MRAIMPPPLSVLKERTAFRRRLLAWHRRHGRHQLPWRQTRDPYAVLVSEIMLQQTQVATVIPYYQRWLARFPDFRALAGAPESEVLHAWQGLGYYTRARNLHALAKTVIILPSKIEELRRLPGIGRYIAHAVATFAFDQAVPVVEANIARLLARLTNSQLPIDSVAGAEHLWNTAAELLPKTDAARFNSALMDLGALVCVSRQPKCEQCPVRDLCAATDPATLPIKRSRAPLKLLTEHHAFAFHRGRILLEQSDDRWRGMWILPRLTSAGKVAPVYRADFPFTNHRITLAVYPQRLPLRAAHRWFPLDALASIPLPSPHRRAVTHLLGSR